MKHSLRTSLQERDTLVSNGEFEPHLSDMNTFSYKTSPFLCHRYWGRRHVPDPQIPFGVLRHPSMHFKVWSCSLRQSVIQMLMFIGRPLTMTKAGVFVVMVIVLLYLHAVMLNGLSPQWWGTHMGHGSELYCTDLYSSKCYNIKVTIQVDQSWIHNASSTYGFV